MVSITENPPVSVLMSVYDPPLNLLVTSVESVLAQTFSDFEFLIFNDGSRDAAVAGRLDRWASEDRRVRVFHEPHRGVPRVSNRGLATARGEYVARHDADDWSEPIRLQRQVAFLKEHPDIALVGTDAYTHAACGKPLWRLKLPHSPHDLSHALSTRNPFVHGSTMFRRAAALAIGGYREEFPCSSDYDFLWRLTEAGGAANLDEVLYHYRYTGGSISARRATDQARVYRAAQVLAAARRAGEIENIAAALGVAGQMSSASFRALLKQADHLMLAGEFPKARKAYLELLRSRPGSLLAWAKVLRLAVFRALPPVREACFR